jgi:hypothetical protein
MAIVYAQNIIELAFVGVYAGRPHVNVLHVHNDEGSQSDAAKARDVLNNWQDHIVGLPWSSSFGITELQWRSIDPDDANAGTLAPDPAKPVTGTYTGTSLPPNVTALIKKRTDNRPRGRRDGRFYISGVPEIWVRDDGTVEPDAQATVQTGLDAFVSGVNDDVFGVGGGSGLAVLETTAASRMPGTQPVTINWRPVTGLQVDRVVATQRDRVR